MTGNHYDRKAEIFHPQPARGNMSGEESPTGECELLHHQTKRRATKLELQASLFQTFFWRKGHFTQRDRPCLVGSRASRRSGQRPSHSADARAVRNISSAESAHAYLFVLSPNHSIFSRRRKSACSLQEPWTRRSISTPSSNGR